MLLLICSLLVSDKRIKRLVRGRAVGRPTERSERHERWHADDEIAHKLDEVSGIGLLTASALKTAVGKPERFASGRHLSAWLGMTPNEYSSGERRRLGRISCKGNVYVRTLFYPWRESRTLGS